ncbi:MAG: FlgD immunoglobulin-like domain containing protein, partial [Endomicrobiia bacterium]|nr:FlgD immunoglobulin-like domain containing protein [Endomicrobiia bacterium]
DNTIEEKLFGHSCIVLDDANISGLSVSPKKYFNPDAAQSATISYTLSKAAKVTAKIYSRESGTEIKMLLDNTQQSAGANQIYWNGRDSSEQIVPDGVYAIVIKTARGDVKAVETAVIGH